MGVKSGERAIVHLLAKSEDGPIVSRVMGNVPDNGKEIRFHVACSPKSPLPQFASGESASVNCPLCLKTAAYEALKAQQDEEPNEADAAAKKAIAAAGGACEGC